MGFDNFSSQVFICFINSICKIKQIHIFFRYRSHLHQIIKIHDLFPVFIVIDNNRYFFTDLFCLDQGKEFHEFVQRTEAARENDQCFCQIKKPEFAHEEIMEVQAQFFGNPFIP